MKAVKIILKILTALAAVAGAVYVIAKYGDKIVSWAKGLLGCDEDECECCEDCDGACCKECECADECVCAQNADRADEDVTVEEVPVEEAPEEGVVASEADFEG